MTRIRFPRPEAVLIRRLQQCLDGRRCQVPELRREAIGCYEHEIGLLDLLDRERLGMADDPQHVALAARTPNRRQAVQHDVHVA